MKKNKIIIFLIIVALVFPLCLIGCANNDYARITEMDYKAVVVDEPDSEGKIVVTERITFDVHAASRANGFWELWRDLCESWVDGVHVHYKVNSVKQIMPDGSEMVWAESPQLYWYDEDYVSPKLGPGKWYHSEGPYNEYNRQYECLLFYVDDLYREKVTFEIEYEMYNAVLKYNDCADLYIAMYSGDTMKYLESFNAEILIPDKDMPRNGEYTVTTYGTNKDNFPVEESATKNPGYYTFSFNLGKDDLKFKSYNEYIEFDLVTYGEDKHRFADHAPSNDYTRDDVLEEIWASQAEYVNKAKNAKIARVVILITCIIGAGFVIAGGKSKISYLKKKNPLYSIAEVKDVYREIPSDLDPKFAAALVFCKDKEKKDDAGVYAALLLSLARKNYIELKEMSDANDVLITIKNDEEFLTTETSAGTADNSIGCNSSTKDSVSASIHDYAKTYAPVGQVKAIFPGLERVEPIRPAPDIIQSVPTDKREPLTECETHYLNLIKRHAIENCIAMNILQRRISIDYDYTKAFERNIKDSVITQGVNNQYFQTANWDKPKRTLKESAEKYIGWGIAFTILNLLIWPTRVDLAFGAFFLLGAAFLATGLYLKQNAHKYVLLTQLGEQEYKKWRGLYNFLNSDTLIHDKTFVELPLWEKYLVYATAFDISEKVIKAIKIRCPEAITARETKSIVYNPYCRSTRIRTYGRSFHNSVRTSAHRGSYGGGGYSRSSGGSSGFGYGGGGRGGGGGGGGH